MDGGVEGECKGGEKDEDSRRTLTTRELALLCSYARSALFTSGMFDTRESDFHSSPPGPSPCVTFEEDEDEDGMGSSRRRIAPSEPCSCSSRRSSSIRDGEGRDGVDVPDVTDSAGVGWNAASKMQDVAPCFRSRGCAASWGKE